MEAFDCEALAGSFPQQPINTLSSLALIVAGAVLWRRGRRVVAAAVVLAGVGSVLFHGAPSMVSTWAHDAGIVATAVAAVVEVWKRTAVGRPPWSALGVGGVGVVVWGASRTGGPLCRPESVLQGHAVWHVLAAVALVLLFGARWEGESRNSRA